ncbi:MAG: hybrid sensor histidine kinase/response regulator, partial [Candidatus Rokuibacteriota bacterium]
SETVRRIQQFARLRPDEQFVPVDLNTIVREAVAITKPRWEEKIAHENRPLDLDLELPTVPPIRGRQAALTEVVTNLILNAMDAMPQGGRLRITTRPLDSDVEMTVTDTGIGIPPAVQRRIFDPFFSTKGEGGSGLGLSMAYSIVKRHGGEIGVTSRVGKGTCFTLSFPIAREPGVTAPGPVAEAPRREARVLVVDDDRQVLSTLTELLRSVGHTVLAVSSGVEALAAYAPGRFDVVLTNLGMAGMNGWQLAERVRAADRTVAILFITGWGLGDGEHARLASLKIHRCLFKPVRPGELDAAIQAAVNSA